MVSVSDKTIPSPVYNYSIQNHSKITHNTKWKSQNEEVIVTLKNQQNDHIS
jgi:hypothetical protein